METDAEAGLWTAELDALLLRVGERFGRIEPRRRMRDYVRGLLGPVGRKNSWQLAEHADSNRLLVDIAAQGAQFLIRATSVRRPPVLALLPDGSYLTRIGDLSLRVSCFRVATDRVTPAVCATHEAPVPLGEVFDVSTHRHRSQCREVREEAAHVKWVGDTDG